MLIVKRGIYKFIDIFPNRGLPPEAPIAALNWPISITPLPSSRIGVTADHGFLVLRRELVDADRAAGRDPLRQPVTSPLVAEVDSIVSDLLTARRYAAADDHVGCRLALDRVLGGFNALLQRVQAAGVAAPAGRARQVARA